MQKKQNQSNSSTFCLPGVGKQIAKHLARLNIYSAHDLLFHFPARYQDRTHIQSISHLVPGEAVIEGVIKTVSIPKQGRTKLFCELYDGTGSVYLRFFHILSFQTDLLKLGKRLRCYSEVRLGAKGFEMIHPECQVILPNQPIPVEKHLTPIYPATEGLSQYMLRKLTTNALTWMETVDHFQELLPEEVRKSFSFPTLKEALLYVHRPPQTTSILELQENKTIPQKRLIFEELLAHRISLLNLKYIFQSQIALSLKKNKRLPQTFLKQLPFQLTEAQKRVVKEISEDLKRPHPMLRLVQGDVGSGKTVVAALAMLQAVENNFQAAMMAPTELLAEQHFRVLKSWFEPLGIKVLMLTSHVKARAREDTLNDIKNGTGHIIVGTHALFQEDVSFSKLALIVIDEQHRFGVQQRALLREKGMRLEKNNEICFPHQLVMTATPIPRTLAMSFYADLDCSIIDELPPGRKPIVTSVLTNTRRDEVILRIREACKLGRQAYWVCPLIEESEVIACQAATKTLEDLQQLLPELKMGLIHGRMPAKDKESTMRLFQTGQLHLLVATTVIEVGVDVANASLMIIENAERLGLSQLHQLRGRVGRGASASHCVLLYQHPLSNLAKERLTVMRETTDGFKIAERDLTLRGPGEVLGTRQTGDLLFQVADLIRDSEMLPSIHDTAHLILRDHQEYIDPLVKRWLGNRDEYGKV